MNTVRFILTCSSAALLLSACSSTYYPEPTTTVTRETVVPDSMFGVVESIQLVQVVSPPVSSNGVAGVPVSPARSTYQVGVRLNQGGYQVFTQEDVADLHVGEQVRIDHGIVRHV